MSEEEDNTPLQFETAFVKLDFKSKPDYVQFNLRVITKEPQDEESIEDEDEFVFYREDGEVPEQAIMECMGLLAEAEIPMPEEYYANILYIINCMIKDPTCYATDDIRLLWDLHPDGQPPSVEPRVLFGDLKLAVDEFVSLPGMSYR